jgi:hypothetical protein
MCVCLNNESLDPTGQDANKAVGKFLIPSTVKTVGVAGTTFADINELY